MTAAVGSSLLFSLFIDFMLLLHVMDLFRAKTFVNYYKM